MEGGIQGFSLRHQAIKNSQLWAEVYILFPPQQAVINTIIIHSKYFPDSDWLKAHA